MSDLCQNNRVSTSIPVDVIKPTVGNSMFSDSALHSHNTYHVSNNNPPP